MVSPPTETYPITTSDGLPASKFNLVVFVFSHVKACVNSISSRERTSKPPAGTPPPQTITQIINK